MKTDLERDLRDMMHRTAEGLQHAPAATPRLIRRARVRRAGTALLSGVAVLALVVGGIAASGSLLNGLNPTEPSGNRPPAEPSPTRRPEPSIPFLLDLQTGDTTPLPRKILGGSLYFTSPDRTKFVINSCCYTPNPVSIANVDGTGVRRVTPDGIDGFAARWSPDGSSLVYQGRNAATEEIGNLFVVDVATEETTKITDLDPASYGWWALHPSFSSDGQTIIFHMPRGPNDGVSTRWDLWSVPVAGGEPKLVVRNASMGAYAPDGEALAYLDSPRGKWTSSRLMVADVDGGDPRQLVKGDQIDLLRWSPDGTRIAYTDSDGGHVVDVSTGDASLVANASVGDWFGGDKLVMLP